MTEKLSPFHATILIYMTQIGMGLFTLPRLLAEQFGTNGWLMLPIAFLLSTLNILLVAMVYRLGQGRSIFQILEQSLSKFILYLLYWVLIGIWSVTGCLIAKYYIIVFQMVAYPTANPTIFKFIVDILLFFLIIKGLYNIAKAATIFYWLTVPLLLLMLYYFKDFEWARLTTFVFRDHHMSASGALNLYFNFIGFEVGLLLFPYINRKTKLIKSLLVSNSMVVIVYIYVCFITFGFYGYKHLSTLQFPILNILAYIQLHICSRYGKFILWFLPFLHFNHRRYVFMGSIGNDDSHDDSCSQESLGFIFSYSGLRHRTNSRYTHRSYTLVQQFRVSVNGCRYCVTCSFDYLAADTKNKR
ncbi:GerAB/ArcD/ProY family transporter [Paenibacillus sp. YSY-4.3]